MKPDYRKLETESKDFLQPLNELEEFAYQYAIEKLDAQKNFMKNHAVYMDKMSDYPEKWQNMMMYGYLFSKVIFDPLVLKKFFKAVRSELPPRAENMLKTWKVIQPVWSIFTVSKTDNPDFFTATDSITGEDRLLYSRGIKEELKNPGADSHPFLCALFYTGR